MERGELPYRTVSVETDFQQDAFHHLANFEGYPFAITNSFTSQILNIKKIFYLTLQDTHYEWSETDILSHGFSGLSLHRADSLTQRPLAALKRTGSKGSAYSLRSLRKEVPKPTTTVERPPTIPDSGFGTLEVKLAYENATSSLAVTVLRARGLIGMDMTGLSDPFCRLEVLPRGELF